MSLIADPALVLVNDVIVQCQINAQHHHYTGEVLSRPSTARLLQHLAADRHALAARLARQLFCLGGLPRLADSELESLHELGDRLLAHFGGYAEDLLLRERAGDERRLADIARQALAHGIPGALGLELARLVDDARGTEQRIRGGLAYAPHGGG